MFHPNRTVESLLAQSIPGRSLLAHSVPWQSRPPARSVPYQSRDAQPVSQERRLILTAPISIVKLRFSHSVPFLKSQICDYPCCFRRRHAQEGSLGGSLRDENLQRLAITVVAQVAASTVASIRGVGRG